MSVMNVALVVQLSPSARAEPEDEPPESFRTNSKKERLLLSYAENFQRQFRQLYSDRKTLFLKPVNECGIEVRAVATIDIIDYVTYIYRYLLQSWMLAYNPRCQLTILDANLQSWMLAYNSGC